MEGIGGRRTEGKVRGRAGSKDRQGIERQGSKDREKAPIRKKARAVT